jgi:hypothetical protein
MLFAGHDTSSAMLTWTLHALTRHPALPGPPARRRRRGLRRRRHARLRDAQAPRLRRRLPQRGAADLQHRADRHPQGARRRPLRRLQVPAGCLVMLHLQALHKDPGSGPSPTPSAPSASSGRHRQAWRWLPFVNGPRSCVGQHFALLEAKIVLSLLTQRFDFTPAPGNSDARHRFNVPVGPRGKICVRVRRRPERRRRGTCPYGQVRSATALPILTRRRVLAVAAPVQLAGAARARVVLADLGQLASRAAPPAASPARRLSLGAWPGCRAWGLAPAASRRCIASRAASCSLAICSLPAAARP